MAQGLEKLLGQPVVVENKEGGGGAVGLGLLYKAAPDGYTIGVGTGTNMTIAPHALEVTYDPLKFSYVSGYAEFLYALVVSAQLPVKTVNEFTDYAKANPGKVVLATTGGFGIHDVGMAMLAQKAGGFEWRTLPTNSSAEATTRVLAGDANVRITSPGPSLDYMKEGSLRALAVMSPSWSELEKSGIPNMKDVHGFSLPNSMTIIAPPGLPEEIRQKLESAVADSLKDKEVLERLDKIGERTILKNSTEIKAETERLYNEFGVIVERLGQKKK